MVRIEDGPKLDFKDVLIRPKRSTLRSRSQVTLDTEITFRNSKQKWTGVPIMVANMDTTGTFEMAKALAPHKLITCMHKHYSVADVVGFRDEVAGAEHNVMNNIAISLGTSDADFAKTNEIVKECPEVKMLCIDIANGYSEHFVDHVRRCRERHADMGIIAGNVVTGEMVEELLLTGADAIKVGIGPGSVCTTRYQTGVGYPQLSAVIECADAAHGLNGHIVADGENQEPTPNPNLDP
uniref:GMP reductase n=1 Tax=Phaeomonas parva TaxID=124430 RepID=A0A7S1UE12_9STRA|mmetsp:Transcript_43942/g.138104  ORF Transcript_43942/g.138104 Transcript_43942/m.138104 type:complete len:238 (+) Transcript_43942:190-903(+)